MISSSSTAALPDLQLALPAHAENVAVVRHAFGGLATAIALAEPLAADIKLAVTEACTNVVLHAYRDVPGGGLLEVNATLAPDALTVVVRDFGAGISPRTDSPGLGLGLPMIATLADSMELCGGGAGQPTEVRMTFSRNPSE